MSAYEHTPTYEVPAPQQAVRVQGRLDESLSRWLWIVKGLLLIPHYIILFFLWVAFVVVTVVAFVAILITGRYPRSLFGFCLGVLRWTWRVSYYGHAGLATDRYPPFSLGAEPDYPATLDIAYPEHLSRGLALVKWWLLAIPQYIVLGFIAGGAAWTVTTVNASSSTVTRTTSSGANLITVLAVFAGVALLFGHRYPRGLFDLVMGLDRWVLRVVAYAALMTDEYPPFRLDQGGDEPVRPLGPGPADPTGSTAAAVVPPQVGPADVRAPG